LRPLSSAAFGRIDAVFTDVDGTLTTRGALLPSTLAAMARLRKSGLKVVLVTGRPSGWGECWARTLPVDGVIAENGGLWFAPVRGRWEKRYAEAPAVRAKNRQRLTRLIAGALRAVPGAALSMDAVATEVDLAFDYNEHVRLGPSAAAALEQWLTRRGVTAVRSSVHVNCWLGPFDKLSTARAFVRREWGQAFDRAQRRFVYAGDSLNDAPMFGGFTHSVGVANVRQVLEQLPERPAYVTRAAEGHGFEELARALLARRRR
jgi:HAD superfamily hydrolase (TIGR01484 family)